MSPTNTPLTNTPLIEVAESIKNQLNLSNTNTEIIQVILEDFLINETKIETDSQELGNIYNEIREYIKNNDIGLSVELIGYLNQEKDRVLNYIISRTGEKVAPKKFVIERKLEYFSLPEQDHELKEEKTPNGSEKKVPWIACK